MGKVKPNYLKRQPRLYNVRNDVHLRVKAYACARGISMGDAVNEVLTLGIGYLENKNLESLGRYITAIVKTDLEESSQIETNLAYLVNDALNSELNKRTDERRAKKVE